MIMLGLGIAVVVVVLASTFGLVALERRAEHRRYYPRP